MLGAIAWDVAGDDPELAHLVASEAIRGLNQFREESEFSTWVYEIAKRQVWMVLRWRARHPEQPFEEEPAVPFPDEIDSRITFDLLANRLDPKEQELLRGKREGKDQNELATERRTTSEAFDSRWQRFKKRTRKKYPGFRDG